MYDALAPAVDALDAALGEQAAARDGAEGRQRRCRRPAATRPRRCWPARAGPAISASAASATRTPAPPPWRCCSRRRPSRRSERASASDAAPRGDERHDAADAIGGARGVGLVVVSHSRALARAAVALAAEMLHGRPVRIEVAAGLDETTFGTDAVQHQGGDRAGRRPGRRRRPDGPRQRGAQRRAGPRPARRPAVRDRVMLSPAPIVEGLVVAAVAAAGGASRAEVAAEARGALLGKAAHLSAPADDARRRRDAGPAGADEVVGVFTVDEPARPARPAGRPAGQRGARPRRHRRSCAT